MGANTGTFECSVSEPGTIYFAVMEIGTNRNRVVQSEIYEQTLETGVSYGHIATEVVNTISTIQAEFVATGL